MNCFKREFTINSYYRCVVNQIINGQQCTIVWYVDDNKLSHMYKKVNGEIIKDLKEILEI